MMIVSTIANAPTDNEHVVDVDGGANGEIPGVELEETRTTALFEESIEEFVNQFNDIVLEANKLVRINESTASKRSGKQLQTKEMAIKNTRTVLGPQ